jgi:ribosomal protein S18 acetylase RimI-like enzyme
MIEYWPISKVISDFYAEMAKPDSFCLTAGDKQVIGFVWGYRLESTPEVALYLEAPGADEIIKRSYSGTKMDFLYIDEMAVSPKYQGQGVGFELITNVFYRYPREIIYLRTLENSAMFKLVTKMDGRTILKISKGRVIMELLIPDSVFGGAIRR